MGDSDPGVCVSMSPCTWLDEGGRERIRSQTHGRVDGLPLASCWPTAVALPHDALAVAGLRPCGLGADGSGAHGEPSCGATAGTRQSAGHGSSAHRLRWGWGLAVTAGDWGQWGVRGWCWELGLGDIYTSKTNGPLYMGLASGIPCAAPVLVPFTGRGRGDRGRGTRNHPRPRHPRRGHLFYQLNPHGD